MIIFDIFNLFLTGGHEEDFFEKQGKLNKEELKKYIFDEHPPVCQCIFRYELINTLFKLRENKVEVGFFSRYNIDATNAILSKLGIKKLFDLEIYDKRTIKENDIIFSSYDDDYNGIKNKINNISELEFDNIWNNYAKNN